MATKIKNGINIDGGNVTVAALTASQFVKTDSSKNLTSSLIVSTDLPTTGITNTGTFTNATVTIDSYGRVTAASTGSGATGASLSADNTFTGANTFKAGTNNTIPLTVAAATGNQNVDIFDITDGQSNNTKYYVKVDSTGKFSISNSSTYSVSIVPTTLTASRTLTLPNVDGTAITTGDSGTVTSTILKSTSGSEAVATANIQANAVTTAKLPNSTSTSDGVTTAKIQYASANKFLAGTSTVGGADAAPTFRSISAQDLPGYVDPHASSTSALLPMPRYAANATVAISTAGTVYGFRAIATASSIANVRFVLQTAGTSVTDFKVGVWNSSLTLIAQTANLATTINGTAPAAVTAALSTSGISGGTLTLTPGSVYYIGFSSAGGTPPSLRGTVATSQLSNFSPATAATATGFTSGNLPNLSSTAGATNQQWVEGY